MEIKYIHKSIATVLRQKNDADMSGLPGRTEGGSEANTLKEEIHVVSQIEELYPNINFARLKSIILNWVNKDKHPVSKVTLYKNAEAESEPSYIFVAELPPFPGKKMKRQQILQQLYRIDSKSFSPEKDSYPPKRDPKKFKYTPEDYAVIEVYESTLECAHLWDWLPQIYEGVPPEDYRDEWMWFNIEPEEDLDDDFVREDTRYVLFGDIDNVSEALVNNKEAQSILDMPRLNVEDYIKKRKADGAHKNLIAFELYDEEGDYDLTHLEIARALGLDYEAYEISVKTIKQRGKRAVDRGRTIFKKKLKMV